MENKDMYLTLRDTKNQNYLKKLLHTKVKPLASYSNFNQDFAFWYSDLILKSAEKVSDFEKYINLKNTCQEGCTACCSHLIEVYNYELLPIINFLNTRKKTDLKKNIIKRANSIEENILNRNGDYNNLTEDETMEIKINYRELSMPCIFLQNNRCSIYPIRPSCCATYYSYSSPELCEYSDILPNTCYSYSHIEDWIAEQVYAFYIKNQNKIQLPFDPFELSILPIGLKKLILRNNLKI